jgi:lactate 2-monooxygenase
MLRPIVHRDMTIKLFGFEYDSPILVSPIGVQSIFHADKEVGVAEVAAEIGVPYVLSTASSSTIEEVAASSDKGQKVRPFQGGEQHPFNGSRWYQLYWPANDTITISVRIFSRGWMPSLTD